MMKNFDLDNLDRKNSYTTPPNFFEAMQNNVLKQTVDTQKTGKIIPINFRWLAAAAVTAIAGLSIWTFTKDDTPTTMATTDNIMIMDSSYTPKQDDIAVVEKASKDQKTTVKKTHDFVETEQYTASGSPKKTKELLAEAYTKKEQNTISATPKGKTVPESKMNQVLAVFTSAQISELEKGVDQDVYLDLYN